MSAEGRVPGHLESGEVAAFLDGALSPPDRSRLAAHLMQCDACRNELIEMARLFHTRPRRRRWYVPVGAATAVAAAALLLVVWSRPGTEVAVPSGYREPAVTTAVAPIAIAPRGVITLPLKLVWSAVPRADRYRLTLFDATGIVVWETQTADTVAPLPESMRLRPGAPYLWKVEAQTGWRRWVGSDLVEFSIVSPRP